MPLNTKKTATTVLIASLLAFGLSLSLQSVLAAWVAPAAPAPGGNVSVPIFASSTVTQTIAGGGNLRIEGAGLTVNRDSGNQINILTSTRNWSLDVDTGAGNTLRIRDMSAGGANRLVIDTSGRVGMGGVTAPAAPLHVGGGLQVENHYFDANNDEWLRLRTADEGAYRDMAVGRLWASGASYLNSSVYMPAFAGCQSVRVRADGWAECGASSGIPVGLVCGLSEDNSVKSSCQGHNAALSCPSGYVQRCWHENSEGGEEWMCSCYNTVGTCTYQRVLLNTRCVNNCAANQCSTKPSVIQELVYYVYADCTRSGQVWENTATPCMVNCGNCEADCSTCVAGVCNNICTCCDSCNVCGGGGGCYYNCGGGGSTPYLFNYTAGGLLIENDVLDTYVQYPGMSIDDTRRAYEGLLDTPDYLPSDIYKLRLKPDTSAGEIKLRIREIEPEESMFDSVELIRVIRDRSDVAFTDNYRLITARESRIDASNCREDSGRDCLADIRSDDRDIIRKERGQSAIVEFDLPAGEDEAFLNITAWENHYVPAVISSVIADGHAPSLWYYSYLKDGTWRKVGKNFHPRAIRASEYEMIDLKEAAENGKLTLRIEWTDTHSVDRISLVTTHETPHEQEVLTLRRADKNGKASDIFPWLSSDHDYAHLVRGDHYDLVFAAGLRTLEANEAEDYFFVSKGYYHGLRADVYPDVDPRYNYQDEVNGYIKELNEYLERSGGQQVEAVESKEWDYGHLRDGGYEEWKRKNQPEKP